MFIQYLKSAPEIYVAIVITVIFSICVHELAHGLAAIRLGDDTPIESGHMNLNPLTHMGGMSLVMLLIVGIAWGAMPINPARLARHRYGEAIVAAAGPLSNILLALIALTGLGLWVRFGGPVVDGSIAERLRWFLEIFGMMNIVLAIFNLLPCPPLDGARIVANLSPQDSPIRQFMNSGGAVVLFLVVFFTAGKWLFPAGQWITKEYLKLLIL